MEEAKIFDSHAHYDDGAFDGEREALLSRLHHEEGVEKIINAGAGLVSTECSCRLAETHPFIRFCAGIHPENAASDIEDADWKDKLRGYLASEKCAAVGEIGLDYYYTADTRDTQIRVFEEQLLLAKAYDLPVVIHDRDAHGDCMDIVRRHPDVTGVFHSYSGSFEMAKELLSRGWYLSVGGIVTFKNARKIVEVMEGLRDYENGKYLSRLLLETDCPYLAPVPMRGTRNHSGNIRYTAEKCGEIFGISAEEVLALTFRNAEIFFRWEDRHE